MSGKKIDKEAKELATNILEAQDISYEEWLNEQHQKVIISNFTLLKEGLKSLK